VCFETGRVIGWGFLLRKWECVHQLAKEKGLRRLVVNVESSIVVGMLRGSFAMLDMRLLFTECKSLIESLDWEVVASHCCQEANQVADALLDVNVELNYDLVVFANPPREVSASLYVK